MNNGLRMILHGLAAGIILYVILRFVLGQEMEKAEDRSILFGAVVLVYMILFGHSLPTRISENIL